MRHRSRDLLMRQRTMILNAIRAHFAEFGIIAAQGPRKVAELVIGLAEESDPGLPETARSALLALAKQLDSLAQEVRKIERQLLAWHRQSAASQRLETIPGVGLTTATALAASVPDPTVFKSGRQFAAYLGLVPRQNSSGGKDRLGHISKMGNGYLRRLLVVGATSVTRRAPGSDRSWSASLPGLSLSLSPTRPPEPHGHCSRREKATRPHRLSERRRYKRRSTSPQTNARAQVDVDDRKGPLPGHPEALSGLQSSLV